MLFLGKIKLSNWHSMLIVGNISAIRASWNFLKNSFGRFFNIIIGQNDFFGRILIVVDIIVGIFIFAERALDFG